MHILAINFWPIFWKIQSRASSATGFFKNRPKIYSKNMHSSKILKNYFWKNFFTAAANGSGARPLAKIFRASAKNFPPGRPRGRPCRPRGRPGRPLGRPGRPMGRPSRPMGRTGRPIGATCRKFFRPLAEKIFESPWSQGLCLAPLGDRTQV